MCLCLMCSVLQYKSSCFLLNVESLVGLLYLRCLVNSFCVAVEILSCSLKWWILFGACCIWGALWILSVSSLCCSTNLFVLLNAESLAEVLLLSLILPFCPWFSSCQLACCGGTSVSSSKLILQSSLLYPVFFHLCKCHLLILACFRCCFRDELS